MKSQDITAISTSIIALGVVVGGVIFFIGQNEKAKDKAPVSNREEIERRCMRLDVWTKELVRHKPYEECMRENGLVP